VLSSEHTITNETEEAEAGSGKILKEAEAGSGKILKEAEAFWQNKLKVEAEMEAANFIRSGSESKKSQEWGSGSKLGSMTLQEELEAEAKNILLLPH